MSARGSSYSFTCASTGLACCPHRLHNAPDTVSPHPEMPMPFNTLQGRALLVVEDDPDLGALIVAVLASEGAVVAGPWETARLANASVIERRPAAALLDVKLRDGDSYGLAAALEAMGVPYAFLSASDPSDVPEALHPLAFLRKPVAIRDLVAIAASMTAAR
jgi:DNA-binding response OmpR family regulator